MNKELQNKIQTSQIFSRFEKIPGKAFYDFYFFYQCYFQQISTLDFDEYIEIKFNYIQALYHLDKYHQFFIQADELIFELLNNHSFEARPRKIYEKVLFYKAEALHNERKMKSAENHYGELMKLNPTNKIYKRKLFYLLYQNEQIRNRKKVALVVVLILLSLLCSGLSIFVIQPFFSEWTQFVSNSRNVFFMLGISTYLTLQWIQISSALKAIQGKMSKL